MNKRLDTANRLSNSELMIVMLMTGAFLPGMIWGAITQFRQWTMIRSASTSSSLVLRSNLVKGFRWRCHGIEPTG